jgi:D-alanine-D-alanine ligase
MATAAQLQPPQPVLPAISTHDITVLLGGPSEEREVSLNSGRAVASALRRCGHRVTTSDISSHDLSALGRSADLTFIALHGSFGEDGQLQAILEERSLPFVGSNAAASRLAMDKAASKRRFTDCGIPTPAYTVVHARQINQTVNCWKLPTVIKPVDQGSSVDTMIARDAFGFQSAVERVIRKYGSCLIEEYIKGPELTVGILGNDALPVCEIRTPREFYDYKAKYIENTTEYLFDLDLPEALLNEVQRLSLEAHRALGCTDFSRVDWMVDRASGRPYVLEVNTIPGFTDHSLLPKAAAQAGLSFDQLCQRIVEMAMARA